MVRNGKDCMFDIRARPVTTSRATSVNKISLFLSKFTVREAREIYNYKFKGMLMR